MKQQKLLYGSELAGFIKERQARDVRRLKQSEATEPRLAIVQTSEDPVISTYVRMKQHYGADIGVAVEQHQVASSELVSTIQSLNERDDVHGIIIQLPLDDTSQTEQALNLVDKTKDVDGLSEGSDFVPATAMAIDWLLAGYNVALENKSIAIIGKGRLVGAPLATLWQTAGHDVTVFDRTSTDMTTQLKEYEIIISAAGQPGLIAADSLKSGAVVVDAATSAEHGKIIGDVAADVYERHDLVVTPPKGGVGPLTVAALFDNVLRGARDTVTRRASL